MSRTWSVQIQSSQPLAELSENLKSKAAKGELQDLLLVQTSPSNIRGATESLGAFGELVVAIGSAGAFSALYGIIKEFLKRDKNKEIVLVHGEARACVKGYSARSARELIEALGLFSDQEGGEQDHAASREPGESPALEGSENDK